MSGRELLAWSLGVATVVIALVGIGLGWATGDADVPAGMDAAPGTLYFVSWLAFAGPGALVAAKRPANAVGWILLAIGLCWELAGLAGVYRDAALLTAAGLPGGVWSAWVWDWSYVPGIVLVPLLFLLFPDGRLPSRRWWPVPALLAAGAGLFWTSVALRPGPLPSTLQLSNPAGVEIMRGMAGTLEAIGGFCMAAATLAALASLVARYRRADAVARLQLKWVAFAAGVIVLAMITASVLDAAGARPELLAAFRLVPLLGLPPAVAVAVLGYRLYDIDVVLTRSIVYGALAALIGVVYLAVVVGVGSVIGAREQVGVPLSITATALTAVAFAPARTRLQRLANRMVYGQRASPYEVLSSFTPRVTGAPGGSGAFDEMARTVGEAVGATSGEVWLRVGTNLQRAACWPDAATGAADAATRAPDLATVPVPDNGDGTLALPEGRRAYPVRHHGRLLGALAVTPPGGRRLTPAEDQLLGDLASAAWLVLDNAELIDELRASRQRLVAAQDAERARIEQDLHDGAQQRLLELALVLRTAGAQAADAGAHDAATTLDTAQQVLRSALAELREFARGIHPAILTARGLTQAVESLADRAPLPVTVDAAGVGRLPAPVEATAYFVTAEALTNVIKHARATQVVITARVADQCLHLAIADDGIGGADPSSPGLGGLADRVAALSGQIRVTSSASEGTRVAVELPCG